MALDDAIPVLGFGTWQMTGDTARSAVGTALEVGYRHLDTATVYGNEREVGAAMASSGLARDEIYVTTKLPGNASDVRATLEASLAALRTDHVDLWLIHWPPALSYEHSGNSSVALYEEMLGLREEGLTRAVGVSNYSVAEIDQLLDATGEAPAVNQIPWSPFVRSRLTQAELDARGVLLEGYSPLQTSRLDDPVLMDVAGSLGRTPAQVILRWHLQSDVIVIPKSSHPERIRENFAIFDFELDRAAMARLDALSQERPS